MPADEDDRYGSALDGATLMPDSFRMNDRAWHRLVIVPAAVLILAGCSGEAVPSAERPAASPRPSHGNADGSYQLPSDGWKPGDLAFLAKSGGRFHAWRTPEGACAGWGHGGATALWPAGFRVAFSPTRLLDPTGRVIAREGDWITVSGGLIEAPQLTPCLKGRDETFGVMGNVTVHHDPVE